MGLLEKIFGDLNEKEVKKLSKIADKVESYDEAMQALSDDELRGKTQEFKDRLAAGETLDDILPEAFAACREGAFCQIFCCNSIFFCFLPQYLHFFCWSTIISC